MSGSDLFRRTLVFWALLLFGSAGSVAEAGRLQVQPEHFPGLLAPVRIVWDHDRMPHVFASNDHDAYFAMGYLHARDRLFQMDYSRRLFSGTLAELIGNTALASDIQLRTLGLRRAAERSWEVYSAEAKTLFDAYASGVNAFIQEAGGDLPAEYQSLELTGVEPWTSLDSVTVATGVAFGLSFDLRDIELTQDHDAFVAAGQDQGFDGEALFSQDLDRSAPFDPTVTIPPAPDAAGVRLAGERPRRTPARVSPRLLEAYLEKIRKIPLLEATLREPGVARGSNFWIIGPQHSATGRVLFANDPHLSLGVPAVFYEMQLIVADDPGRGSMNVGGVSFPGTPGIVQGCNERACWGSTVNPMDVTDVYQEQLALHLEGFSTVVLDGTLYEDQVEPFVKIPQTFRVNRVGDRINDNLEPANVGPLDGGVTYVVPRRNNGPLVQVLRNPDNPFDVKALTVQYTGWGATRAGETFFHMARARTVAEFRDALQYFDFGSQNWGYADVDGNIAYFTSAELPIREDLQAGAVDGAPPWFVRDGTHAAHNEWLAIEHPQPLQALGFEILPYAEMPQIVNPTQGYIASANNDPIGVSLDNDVLNQYRPDGGILYLNPGFTSLRIGRIDQMIRRRLAAEPGGLTLEDLRAMQADNQLLDAQVFVPYIEAAAARAALQGADPVLAALGSDAGVSAALQRLAAWDFTTPTGIQSGYDPGDDPASLPEPSQSEIDRSVAATIYAIWRGRIVANVIDATLFRVQLNPYRPDSERSMSALRNLLDHFDTHHGVGASGLNFFQVDGVSAPEDARDILILRSLQEALTALASDGYRAAFDNSTDPADYRWGLLHRIRFNHPLGGAYSLPPAAGYSNVSPALQGLARSGGYEVVDASSHEVRATGINGFRFASGPARRFVGELDPAGIQAYQVIPGGASEERSEPSYASEMGLWLTNQYHTLRLSPADVEADGESEARLSPPLYRFFFPLLEGNASRFTAFALADAGDQPVDLVFRGWSPEGTPLDFPDNPSARELAAGRQVARLASEIFGIEPTAAQSGWVELAAEFLEEPSQWPVLGSFTQFGDFRLQELDGASALLVPCRELYFTMLDPAGENRLSLANVGDEPTTVRMDLFVGNATDSGPTTPAASIERTVPAHGVWVDSVAALFSMPLASDGYVRASADLPGLVGIGWTRYSDPGTLVAVNGQAPGGTSRSYSAQLAFGADLSCRINLLNAGELDRQVVIRAVRGPGQADLSAAPITLRPGEFRRLEAAVLFPGQVSAAGDYFIASLVIDADGDGVIGSVVFSDSAGRRFAAALPLQRQLFRRAVFGHVANLGEFFTGLALFNPDAETATIQVQVFDAGGELQGEGELLLEPGARLSDTLSNLVPAVGEMSGGYIVIDSNRPIVGQEIFGTSDLRLQSAVPPTRLK
ncbi:MAG: penicillin acylase family protein [Acidobacteriota bacterium]